MSSAGPFAWTDRQVRRALGLPEQSPRAELEFVGVTTDSRNVRPGDLYVALVGTRFDGQDFVNAAVVAGARGAVVSRAPAAASEVPLYPVDDTLVALGRLATHRRVAFPGPVMGITGSSGKTATKEFTRGALASSLKVHATRANLNNRVGVPITLLATPAEADVVVVEMGSNEPGEIRILTDIARPTVGVVTTVGESHLEKLGSAASVLEEKLDLVRGLPADAAAVVGDTPPSLPERARALRPRTRVAGWTDHADADLRPARVEVDARGAHSFDWRGARVALAVPGRHMAQNALLALAVSELLGVEPGPAAAGVSAVEPGWMCGQVERAGGLTLLLDCYNANPQSVRAALDLLELQGDAGRRIAVLGSMLELGERSESLHVEVLRDALARGLDAVVAIGAFAQAAASLGDVRGATTLVTADDPASAYTRLRELLSGNEVVLLKASRGIALETILPSLREDFGGAHPGLRRAERGGGAVH